LGVGPIDGMPLARFESKTAVLFFT
jgi:hypothetical protein